MIVKTRIFEIYENDNNGYRNLSELARAMGISPSQIYRVREGKRQINQKFIVGAIMAFPDYRLDDLFYLVPQPPVTGSNNRSEHPAADTANEPAPEEFNRSPESAESTLSTTLV